jgi:hypothetical protein
MEASGFGMPICAASCCSTALESKYSNHAAASCHKPGTKQDTEKNSTKKKKTHQIKVGLPKGRSSGTPLFVIIGYPCVQRVLSFLPNSKWNMNVNMKHSFTNKSGKIC